MSEIAHSLFKHDRFCRDREERRERRERILYLKLHTVHLSMIDFAGNSKRGGREFSV
jgi:hypothetical protein